MSFIIRPAQTSDQTRLSELFLEFTDFNLNTLQGLSKKLLTSSNREQFADTTIDQYFQQKNITFVAETSSGKIVGYISGVLHLDSNLVYYPEAEVIDWFVTADERETGVGRALLETFMTKIKELGCKSVSVEAFADNQEAISLYRRLGFDLDSVILKKII